MVLSRQKNSDTEFNDKNIVVKQILNPDFQVTL